MDNGYEWGMGGVTPYSIPFSTSFGLRVCAFSKWKSRSMDSFLPFFVLTLLDGMILMQSCCFKFFFYILPIYVFIGR